MPKHCDCTRCRDRRHRDYSSDSSSSDDSSFYRPRTCTKKLSIVKCDTSRTDSSSETKPELCSRCQKKQQKKEKKQCCDTCKEGKYIFINMN
jgi:hypothetical protein